jgi:beta-fructofuranosidase
MIYSSEDMISWKFERFVDSADRFGFMWECPDLFELEGKHILSFSPQGLDAEEYRYQNLFQSGYIVLDDKPWDLSCKGLSANREVADTSYVVDESRFVEWDMGFDFYAPQSFVDEKGRTILIGWMGIPGADYDHDPSIDEGWQHMLTLPRVLSYDAALGIVKQNPVEEILELRDGVIAGDMDGNYEVPEIYELVGKTPNGFFEITFDHSLVFRASENDITLAFAGDTGYGRSIRKIKLPCQVQNVRIIVDVSAVEIYINDGQYVMTTKHYPKKDIAREVKVTGDMDLVCYKLKSMEFKN